MEREVKHKMSCEELKRMIVDLKVDLVRANIPRGNCPYAYYKVEKKRDNCENCKQCTAEFFETIRKDIELEVSKY